MKIESVLKNVTVNLYYQTQNLDFADVEFDFYDINGVLLSTVPGTLVSNEHALYTVPFLTPNDDTYIFGVGRYTDGSFPVPFVLQVGNPVPKKIFYFSDEVILTELTYRIYDLFGIIHQLGALTTISSNFAYTDVTDLSPGQQYVLEVIDGDYEVLELEVTSSSSSIIGTGVLNASFEIVLRPTISINGTGVLGCSPGLNIDCYSNLDGVCNLDFTVSVDIDCYSNLNGNANLLAELTNNISCSHDTTGEASVTSSLSCNYSLSASIICNSSVSGPITVTPEVTPPAPTPTPPQPIDDFRTSLGTAMAVICPTVRKKRKYATLVQLKFTIKGKLDRFVKYIEDEISVNLREILVKKSKRISNVRLTELKQQFVVGDKIVLDSMKMEKTNIAIKGKHIWQT